MPVNNFVMLIDESYSSFSGQVWFAGECTCVLLELDLINFGVILCVNNDANCKIDRNLLFLQMTHCFIA